MALVCMLKVPMIWGNGERTYPVFDYTLEFAVHLRRIIERLFKHIPGGVEPTDTFQI